MKRSGDILPMVILLSAVLWGPLGCQSSALDEPVKREQLSHPDPAVRIRAFQWAAEHDDKAAVPYLVEGLTDSNRAVRFYAIEALKRITGETHGYDYKSSEAARGAAVAAWREALQKPPAQLK